MTVTRMGIGSRMSEVVIHGDTIYLSGQVGEGADITKETEDALASVERLLLEAGSDKSHILQVIIWLSSMDDFAEMNAVYDAWIDPANPPARAAGESRLATPDFHVEFTVTAAKKA